MADLPDVDLQKLGQDIHEWLKEDDNIKLRSVLEKHGLSDDDIPALIRIYKGLGMWRDITSKDPWLAQTKIAIELGP